MPCESFNFKQNTCFFQIDRIKTFGEPPKNDAEQILRFAPFSLISP